jgi:D-3-phosphoglycerate dehydrogenase
LKITVLDDYQDMLRGFDTFRRLSAHEVTVWNDHCADEAALAERLSDTEAVILIRERTLIGNKLLARLTRLKLISQFGAVPNIDLESCTRRGVLVCSQITPGGPSYATAELTWGLIIASARRIPQEVQALKDGRWQASRTLGWTLRGRTLGLIGYGRIGAVVAGYGKAFGMQVLVGGSEASRARAAGDGFAAAPTLEALFAGSDVLSVHLPLRDGTRGIVTAALLAAMKPGALFVNTSRAQLVEAGALEAALVAGRPGSAAVDVFDSEPVLGGAHPLLQLDNVIATPHIGYVEGRSIETMAVPMIEQVLAFAAGRPINVLNPQASTI